MKAFTIDIGSVKEGVKLMAVLALYDRFQYDNNVKPDYANAGGISMLEDGEWIDWYDEETGLSDPVKYLKRKGEVQGGELYPLLG